MVFQYRNFYQKISKVAADTMVGGATLTGLWELLLGTHQEHQLLIL
jgi:hypothetical protein